jgi:hypothetical protein
VSKQKYRDVVAILLLLISVSILFTVQGSKILFSMLPKSEGWLQFGIYIPYILVVISIYLLIRYRIKK